jgi:hypothetical protein
MVSGFSNVAAGSYFGERMNYELKRAERYRLFVSLIIFNVGPVLDLAGRGILQTEEDRIAFIKELNNAICRVVREVDAVSDLRRNKIGVLLPETSRQGAEAAARRVSGTLYEFCRDYFKTPMDCLVPIEISSFPDAAGARSLSSYLEEFMALGNPHL